MNRTSKQLYCHLLESSNWYILFIVTSFIAFAMPLCGQWAVAMRAQLSGTLKQFQKNVVCTQDGRSILTTENYQFGGFPCYCSFENKRLESYEFELDSASWQILREWKQNAIKIMIKEKIVWLPFPSFMIYFVIWMGLSAVLGGCVTLICRTFQRTFRRRSGYCVRCAHPVGRSDLRCSECGLLFLPQTPSTRPTGLMRPSGIDDKAFPPSAP